MIGRPCHGRLESLVTPRIEPSDLHGIVVTPMWRPVIDAHGPIGPMPVLRHGRERRPDRDAPVRAMPSGWCRCDGWTGRMSAQRQDPYERKSAQDGLLRRIFPPVGGN